MAAAEATAPIRISEAGELRPGSYTVLARLWTGTWRAAFWIPVHRDSSTAIAAPRRTTAVSAGAPACCTTAACIILVFQMR